MIDENAFGILVAFSKIEDEEYASDDLEQFVDRFTLFQRLTLQYVQDHPPAPQTRGLDLGHAIYVEFPDEEVSGLLAWVRSLRAELAAQALESSVFVTQGGRWVADEGSTDVQLSHAGAVPFASWVGPSEPLRRAMFAETASHGLLCEDDAWGIGFYLDVDAMESLGIRPKNEPTFLEVAGARFVRVSR